MAHIKKMTDKPRKLPWRAHIHRKGHKPVVKMFLSKPEAEAWAGEQERSFRLTGLPLTIDELKKHTVREIVQKYLDEVTPTKGSAVSETTVLKKFLKTDLANMSLAYITKRDGYEYRNKRLKETWKGKPIQPSTVRREVNSIQRVFEVAKEEWGMTNLTNPFRALTIKGGEGTSRERTLKDGELERLEAACDKCHGLNRVYVLIAIYLAVHTGMRLQEIFNLTWADIDLNNRRIEIRKSKTDWKSRRKGRTIVIPFRTLSLFMSHAIREINSGTYKDTDTLFMKENGAMTKDAFKQAWGHVLDNADIDDLTFHDLRHEAGTRFDKAGLTKAEHDLMMGHKSRDMTSRYIHAQLSSIQDKLDRFDLKGKTLEEAVAGLTPEKQAADNAKIAARLGMPLTDFLRNLRMPRAVTKPDG
jgi:integrase